MWNAQAIYFTLIFSIYINIALAHQWRTDTQWCHNDRQSGWYHCHGEVDNPGRIQIPAQTYTPSVYPVTVQPVKTPQVYPITVQPTNNNQLRWSNQDTYRNSTKTDTRGSSSKNYWIAIFIIWWIFYFYQKSWLWSWDKRTNDIRIDTKFIFSKEKWRQIRFIYKIARAKESWKELKMYYPNKDTGREELWIILPIKVQKWVIYKNARYWANELYMQWYCQARSSGKRIIKHERVFAIRKIVRIT